MKLFLLTGLHKIHLDSSLIYFARIDVLSKKSSWTLSPNSITLLDNVLSLDQLCCPIVQFSVYIAILILQLLSTIAYLIIFPFSQNNRGYEQVFYFIQRQCSYVQV